MLMLFFTFVDNRACDRMSLFGWASTHTLIDIHISAPFRIVFAHSVLLNRWAFIEHHILVGAFPNRSIDSHQQLSSLLTSLFA